MNELLKEIRQCTLCSDVLPAGPRPVLEASPNSKIVIIGQAPGSVVHSTGIPWDDKSGENLRNWMGVSSETFYDAEKIAILPMGFCYPGRGKSGDNPPDKRCAPKWHQSVLDQLEEPALILLIGKYAQDYYLEFPEKTLTETVKCFREYLPNHFVLPHPSPRNNIWQAKNPWFKQDVLPKLKELIDEVLNS